MKLPPIRIAFICEEYSPLSDDAWLMRQVIEFAHGKQPDVFEDGDYGVDEMADFVNRCDAVVISCRNMGPKVMAAMEAAKSTHKDTFLAVPYNMGGQGLSGLTEFVSRLIIERIGKLEE